MTRWTYDLNLTIETHVPTSAIMVGTFHFFRNHGSDREEKREKVAEAQVFLIDALYNNKSFYFHDHHPELHNAFFSVRSASREHQQNGGFSDETIEIEAHQPIAVFGGYTAVQEGEMAYLSYDYLEYFSYALEWLQRLSFRYVIIKPEPRNVPTRAYKGKTAEIRSKTHQLMSFYQQFGFETTYGQNEEPYMCCDLKGKEPTVIRYELRVDIPD